MEDNMRLIPVLLLAAIQLTAVPFVTLLSRNTVQQQPVLQTATAGEKMSIVYKQTLNR